MGLMRSALLKASQSEWLARQVRGRRFAQRASRRFLPGENVEAALAAAEQLRERHIPTLITLLGEAITDRQEAERVADEYLDVLDRIEQRDLPMQLSVKLTQVGLDVSRDVCMEQLTRIAARAGAGGNYVCIDMEASPYVDATLAVFRAVHGEHPNLGICLQAYLYRTADDLEALLPLEAPIRLVKGAYNEPPQLAYPAKRDVDANFFKLARRLLTRGRPGAAPHAFGTHDPRLITRIQDFAAGAGVPTDAYELQMLYGIRRDDQYRLAARGYVVRTLISYGRHWFPWYMRRLAERPANLLFVAKSLFR
jgi:proline dehydrogenase